MFPTPLGLVATPPPSFGVLSVILSLILCAYFFSLLRIHGGSFISGSASDPSINGANLAAATKSIVAVVQHRLGGVRFQLLLLLFPH